MARPTELEAKDYRALSAFRYCIRKFLRFSEKAARQAGIEPQHHQLMLAVKGLPHETPATVGELAERLQIQHHSSVELINRLAVQGLVQRKRAAGDRRQVLISLTSRGERILRELSIHHRELLQAGAPELIAALRSIIGGKRRAPVRASDARKAAGAAAPAKIRKQGPAGKRSARAR